MSKKTKEKDSMCTITFETGYGDKATIKFEALENTTLPSLIVEVTPLEPEKFDNLAGDLFNKFITMMRDSSKENSVSEGSLFTGPGGEA